ncbi:hypothetical protein GCM10010492_04420 [Saccharothrix mutabilis subsp. mutabilis]|uniref:Uncharacterized protein n=1 Tax=Saccharothrix mutabilis subsp. mutabilis TaxID=66855 RepID=A0ABN0T261_9PSEU
MQRVVRRAAAARPLEAPQPADAARSFQNGHREFSGLERSGDRETGHAGADHAGVILNGTFGVLTCEEFSHKSHHSFGSFPSHSVPGVPGL